MTTRLNWQSPRAPSCWHACAALATGASLVDPALAQALAIPLAELSAAIEAAGATPRDFLAQLPPLCLDTASSRELALLALTRLLGREKANASAESLAGCLGALRRAYDERRPKLDEELSLRAGPLTEQWQARGPGLLAAIRRLAEPELLPPEAKVILVEPALGGGGEAFPRSNVVTFEALLANPEPRLPEVLRLSWLVAQLNLDLPRYADHLHAARLHRAARLALVPLVLAAAEDVELARADWEMFALALSTWHVHESEPQRVAPLLDEWWQTYRDSRPALTASFVALDRMLDPG
ncbi:MAG: hypothetical protein KF708_22985 [Pirellulales bacterium]|nr:hypothetical protein [Pirellulales bacterium]